MRGRFSRKFAAQFLRGARGNAPDPTPCMALYRGARNAPTGARWARTHLRCLASLLRSPDGGEERDRRDRSGHGRADALRAGQGSAGGNARGRNGPRSQGDPGLRARLLRRSVANASAGPRARLACILRSDVDARGNAADHFRHCTRARPGVLRGQVPGASLVIARDRLPGAVGAAGTGATAGRGAFRRWSTDDTAHRRRARRAAGANACRSLERCTAHPRLVHRQHRRRDDALDQRSLGLDAAPSGQPAGGPHAAHPAPVDRLLS